VAMHALVPAVVGWRALARAQMVDAEAQPLGREPGQAEPAVVRNERRAVVGQDPLRESVQLEEAAEEPQRFVDLGRAADVHGEDEAAVLVADRQRLAALQIAGAPPAFVVRRPECVGLIGADVGLAGGGRAPRMDRATISPQRSRIRFTVRSDGIDLVPLYSSAQISLRAPHRGWALRIATRSTMTSGLTPSGLVRGRRDRSRSASTPPLLYRSSHL